MRTTIRTGLGAAVALALAGAGPAGAQQLAWGDGPTVQKPGEPTPAQKRAAQQAEWAKRAATRTGWEVRGLRLGMTLPELESKLGRDVVEIQPKRRADWQPPAYYAYEEKLRLGDGALFTVAFASPITGGVAGTVMYEQTLSDGPAPDALMKDLVARYGEPDERGASGWWLTWHLKSRVPVPDGLGAFLKVHFRTSKDGKVDYFRAVLNDYKFMMQDESNAAEARRAAERREFERRQSDSVKF